MLDKIFELAQQHKLYTATVALLGVLGGGLPTYFYTIEQNRTDRYEESMLAEFRDVAAAKRDLYRALSNFSQSLIDGRQPDGNTLNQIYDGLINIHQRITVFDVGLTADEKQKITEVQIALSEMKKEVQNARSEADLPYVSGRLAQFDAAYSALEPIIVRKTGTPLLAG